MARCGLCSSNDGEALIEHLAEKLWDSRIEQLEGPVALRPDEHRRLTDYFGLDQRALGVRDRRSPTN